MISKSIHSNQALAPLYAIFLISCRILKYSILNFLTLKKKVVSNSIVFVASNVNSKNVLDSLASSLTLRAIERGVSSYTIYEDQLYRYKLLNNKVILMHWALSYISAFLSAKNQLIIWYSHTRFNVYPYLPFIAQSNAVFFQNSLDASLVRSHIDLARYIIFPGIVYDHEANCINNYPTSAAWENREFDVCLYLAMNSCNPNSYYNNRKNINHSLLLAGELSKSHKVKILLNENAMKYITSIFNTDKLSLLERDQFEIRSPFPNTIDQLSSSRYFVNCSLIEGGPIAILEAINAGCLPISSLYSMASSIPALVEFGLLYDVNAAEFNCASQIRHILQKQVPYELAIVPLQELASRLTESSFLEQIISL